MDTYTSTPEFVVCTERPLVSEYDGRLAQRGLTITDKPEAVKFLN